MKNPSHIPGLYVFASSPPSGHSACCGVAIGAVTPKGAEETARSAAHAPSASGEALIGGASDRRCAEIGERPLHWCCGFPVRGLLSQVLHEALQGGVRAHGEKPLPRPDYQEHRFFPGKGNELTQLSLFSSITSLETLPGR